MNVHLNTVWQSILKYETYLHINKDEIHGCFDSRLTYSTAVNLLSLYVDKQYLNPSVVVLGF